jgi:hypothetical protein
MRKQYIYSVRKTGRDQLGSFRRRLNYDIKIELKGMQM